MIEKSIYEDYTINFSDTYSTNEKSYYFIFNSKRELYLTEDKKIPLTQLEELNIFNFTFKLFIGTYKNHPCFVARVDEEDNFFSLHIVYNINKDTYLMATRAVLINDWYQSHQYCGKCGTKTVIDQKDMMLICPKCGQMHYPRISPAVIMAIEKDNKLLMAKHSYHKEHRYALVAGFVEPGETIEDAVHREVMEEIGIKIKNLKYMRSQSWPFPNSLMIGFTAEYDSGEIKVDGDEIVKAKWFSKDEIQMYPSDISISAWLLQNFIDTH